MEDIHLLRETQKIIEDILEHLQCYTFVYLCFGFSFLTGIVMLVSFSEIMYVKCIHPVLDT